jgi:hypothetical protein
MRLSFLRRSWRAGGFRDAPHRDSNDREAFRIIFVCKHHTLGTTPAVAAGLQEKPWSLEQVVEMTADYMRRKEVFTKMQC